MTRELAGPDRPDSPNNSLSISEKVDVLEFAADDGFDDGVEGEGDDALEDSDDGGGQAAEDPAERPETIELDFHAVDGLDLEVDQFRKLLGLRELRSGGGRAKGGQMSEDIVNSITQ